MEYKSKGVDESPIMKMKKKLLGLALAVLSCFAFTACSDEGKELQDMNLAKYMELGEYTNVEVTTVLKAVTDEEVETQMKSLFAVHAEKIGVTDRAVADGDTVNIDFAGYMNDVAFDGGTGEDYDLEIGSGTFIEGFEDGLIGVMPGKEVDLNLTFPADYHSADLAGQAVVFKVTVNYIIPEITDETVAALENESYGTKAELEAYATEIIQSEVDEENYDNIVRLAMQKIIADTTFKEVPEFLIEQQKAIVEGQLSTTLEGSGVDLDTYLSIIYGTTLDAIAEANVKERMAIQEIANEAGIVVTDEELDAELKSMADDYGVTNEQILEMMGTDREYYREYMYGVKVYDYVYENTTVKEAE